MREDDHFFPKGLDADARHSNQQAVEREAISACMWLNVIYGESGISGNTAGALRSQSRVPPAKSSHPREEVGGGHPSGCSAPCLTRCIY